MTLAFDCLALLLASSIRVVLGLRTGVCVEVAATFQHSGTTLKAESGPLKMSTKKLQLHHPGKQYPHH